jgi:hypothetical protein
VYAETEDWLIERLSRVPIHSASSNGAQSEEKHDVGPTPAEEANGLDGTARPAALDPSAEATAASEDSSQEATVSQDVADAKEEIQHADAGLSAAPLASPGVNPETVERRLEATGTIETSSIAEPSDALERLSAVGLLTRLAASARFFRSADGRFCAQVPVGDRLEIYGLRSAALRDWLIDGYLVSHPEPPSSWAIRRVVAMLEARARFSAGVPEVFIRVGQDGEGRDSAYFLDLGDPSGRAVVIRDQGWRVVDRPGVHFRRPAGLLAMPMPAHDGSIDLLRPYVNLNEAEFRLMIAWLTAALRPVGPYPILVLNGEQSSGKSTLLWILRLLIDPQACPAVALPKSPQDLMATAVNGWLLAYESISSIAGSLSDCLCQLAFGGGFASRALYTNDDRSVIYAQRPVILVGIGNFVVRGDLSDRSVYLHLSPIPRTSRRTERTFWPAFRTDYPRILGGVLDAIAGGLRELPSVDLKELPRMADYAEWGEATSRALGWGAGTFVSTYDDNRMEATEVILEDSVLARVLLTCAGTRIRWQGTPVQLARKLTDLAGAKTRARFPKTLNMFGSELRRIAPQLRLHGVFIDFHRIRRQPVITLKAERRPSTATPEESEDGNDSAGAECSADLL